MSNRKPADHVIPDEVARTASSITLAGRLFLPVPTDVARRFGWTTVPTYEQLVDKLDAALAPSSSAPERVWEVDCPNCVDGIVMTAGEVVGDEPVKEPQPEACSTCAGSGCVRLCGAQDWDRDEDGEVVVLGTCGMPAGHEGNKHHDFSKNEVSHAWHGRADGRAPGASAPEGDERAPSHPCAERWRGETFTIACCPTHGLHGGRETCFECGVRCEQVPVRVVERGES